MLIAACTLLLHLHQPRPSSACGERWSCVSCHFLPNPAHCLVLGVPLAKAPTALTLCCCLEGISSAPHVDRRHLGSEAPVLHLSFASRHPTEHTLLESLALGACLALLCQLPAAAGGLLLLLLCRCCLHCWCRTRLSRRICCTCRSLLACRPGSPGCIVARRACCSLAVRAGSSPLGSCLPSIPRRSAWIRFQPQRQVQQRAQCTPTVASRSVGEVQPWWRPDVDLICFLCLCCRLPGCRCCSPRKGVAGGGGEDQEASEARRKECAQTSCCVSTGSLSCSSCSMLHSRPWSHLPLRTSPSPSRHHGSGGSRHAQAMRRWWAGRPCSPAFAASSSGLGFASNSSSGSMYSLQAPRRCRHANTHHVE